MHRRAVASKDLNIFPIKLASQTCLGIVFFMIKIAGTAKADMCSVLPALHSVSRQILKCRIRCSRMSCIYTRKVMMGHQMSFPLNQENVFLSLWLQVIM